MKTKLLPAMLLLFGCGSADPPAITSITLNPLQVAPGSETSLTVQLANFELRNPATHGQALRAAHDDTEGKENDYPDGGHFHVYIDSGETNPLPLDCPDYCEHPGFASTVRVSIPADAQAGSHELILRLNADDHTFLNPPIEKRAALMLTAPP